MTNKNPTNEETKRTLQIFKESDKIILSNFNCILCIALLCLWSVFYASAEMLAKQVLFTIFKLNFA